MIITLSLVNIYPLSQIFFLVMRMSKIYSLSNFPIYNDIVNMVPATM